MDARLAVESRGAGPVTELAAKAATQRDRAFLASPFAAEIARTEREEGAGARAALLRRALGDLLERSRPGIAHLNMPEAVKSLIEKEYRRIDTELLSAGDEHYDLARHSMRCDFRIVGFNRIPIGLGHIEVGGVPRRLVWSGGLGQAWRAAGLLARAGGWKPFYVSHFTHDINPLAFLLVYNSKSQKEHLSTVAACLRMNPDIRGLIATSWWYDPSLATVAPHFSFLREGALAHGAVLLRSGSSEGARRTALANSPKRQRLYAAGEYVPTNYAVVWSRDALLARIAHEPGA